MDAGIETGQRTPDRTIIERFAVSGGRGMIEFSLRHLDENNVHACVTYLNRRVGNKIITSATFALHKQGRKSRRKRAWSQPKK